MSASAPSQTVSSPHSIKYESVEIAPVQIAPVKTESGAVVPVKLEPVKLESVKLEPVKLESVKLEPATVKLETVKLETVKPEPVKPEPVSFHDVELERPELQQGSAAPDTHEDESAAPQLDAHELHATPSTAFEPTAPARSPATAYPSPASTSQDSRHPHAHTMPKSEYPPVPPVRQGSIPAEALGRHAQLAHPAPASGNGVDIALQWPVHRIVGHHSEHSMVEVQWAEQDAAVPLHPLQNHYVRYDEVSPTLLAEYFHPGPVPAISPSTPDSYRIHIDVHQVAAADLVRLKQPVTLKGYSACRNCRTRYSGFACIRQYGFKDRHTGTAPCDACLVLDRECEVPSATYHHQRSRAAMAPVTATRSSCRPDPSPAAHPSHRAFTPERERSPVASSSSSSRQGNTSRSDLEQRNAVLRARILYLEGLVASLQSGHTS
ncbi:hypothetical protein PENSPDRAFT_756858 [Peniophora sp. CONT]|nr:hypothetical protein PENSPDRAFT_756858 [Peniophora sp. CONT]